MRMAVSLCLDNLITEYAVIAAKMNEVCTFSGNGPKTATIGGYEIDTIASFDYSTIML